MTDRFYALTVVLEKDMREDDAKCLIEAIGMMRHVLDVKGNITNPECFMAQTRERRVFTEKLFKLLDDK